MGRQLDLLVAPFGGAVLTRDQGGAVEATEVPVDEGMPGLGLVRGPLREAEMPFGVLVPRVRLQEGVLGAGARLDVAPFAVENVVASVDQPPGARNGAFVDRVGGRGR